MRRLILFILFIASIAPAQYKTAGNDWTYLIKTSADTSSTTEVFAPIGELQFNVVANETYAVEGVISYTSEATTTGCRLQFLTGSQTMLSATGDVGGVTFAGSPTAYWMLFPNDSLTLTATRVASLSDSCTAISFNGTLRTSTAGAVQFRFHPEVGGSRVTIKQYSWIRYRTIP